MDRLRVSRKTISLRNWRRPSGTTAATAPGSAGTIRPKTSWNRSDGVPLNPLVIDWDVKTTDGRKESAARLPPMPTDTCIVLKYLVDFLLKSKLHKNDLFLLEPRLSEKSKLLQCILEGELPERLSQYSSRSVSFAVLHTIAHTFAPIFPRDCGVELTQMVQQDGPLAPQIAFVARVVQWNMSAERRALFEAVLMLLHHLSLKGTASMNATALGELVATKLVDYASTTDSQHRVGKFFVEYAPEIMRQRQALARSHDGGGESIELWGSPHQRPRSSNAAALASASKIISRTVDNRHDHHDQSHVRTISVEKSPLHQHMATRISAVLTKILQSTDSNLGLFTTPSISLDRNQVKLFLRGEADADVLSLCDNLELGSQLLVFLVNNVDPIFVGFDDHDPDYLGIHSKRDDSFVDRLQQFIMHQLAPLAQDVLVLLLATVRLSMEAGTDIEQLVAAFAPWVFGPNGGYNEAGRQLGSCCHILFTRMHDVLQPLMIKRAREALAQRISVIFRVVVWITKCRGRVIRSRQLEQQALRPWTESMVMCVTEIVEMLLEQTRAYPSQMRRLYLDWGDEMETSIMIEKLCYDGTSISAEIFSPYSAAMAVRQILTSTLRPLGCETGKSHKWLRQLLLTHRDILVRHENSARVRCELEELFDDMLLHGVDQISSGEDDIIQDSDEPQTDSDTSLTRGGYEQSSTGNAQNSEFDYGVVHTLTEWLIITLSKTPSVPKQLSPPPGYTPDTLEELQNRLSDILFVMKHTGAIADSSDTNQGASTKVIDAPSRLLILLEALKIPPVLVSRHRAASTLNRLQVVNRENKVPLLCLPLSARLDDIEIIETLLLEAFSTLQHPALASLYANFGDRLAVVLDVWGLGDRSIADAQLK